MNLSDLTQWTHEHKVLALALIAAHSNGCWGSDLAMVRHFLSVTKLPFEQTRQVISAFSQLNNSYLLLDNEIYYFEPVACNLYLFPGDGNKIHVTPEFRASCSSSKIRLIDRALQALCYSKRGDDAY